MANAKVVENGELRAATVRRTTAVEMSRMHNMKYYLLILIGITVQGSRNNRSFKIGR